MAPMRSQSPRRSLDEETQITVSASCPQCHHLERDGKILLSRTPTGQHARFNCSICQYPYFHGDKKFSILSRRNTVTSLASVETNLEMLDWFATHRRNDRPLRRAPALADLARGHKPTVDGSLVVNLASVEGNAHPAPAVKDTGHQTTTDTRPRARTLDATTNASHRTDEHIDGVRDHDADKASSPAQEDVPIIQVQTPPSASFTRSELRHMYVQSLMDTSRTFVTNIAKSMPIRRAKSVGSHRTAAEVVSDLRKTKSQSLSIAMAVRQSSSTAVAIGSSTAARSDTNNATSANISNDNDSSQDASSDAYAEQLLRTRRRELTEARRCRCGETHYPGPDLPFLRPYVSSELTFAAHLERILSAPAGEGSESNPEPGPQRRRSIGAPLEQTGAWMLDQHLATLANLNRADSLSISESGSGSSTRATGARQAGGPRSPLGDDSVGGRNRNSEGGASMNTSMSVLSLVGSRASTQLDHAAAAEPDSDDDESTRLAGTSSLGAVPLSPRGHEAHHADEPGELRSEPSVSNASTAATYVEPSSDAAAEDGDAQDATHRHGGGTGSGAAAIPPFDRSLYREL